MNDETYLSKEVDTMLRSYSRVLLSGLVVALLILAAVASAASSNGLVSGKADIKLAGPLAFGPDGILFVGDSMQASIFAIETEDTKSVSSPAQVDIKGINEKIAALVGTSADQILVNDVKVNPASKNIYLSASRGRGPDATPLLLRVDSAGKIEVLSLDHVKYAVVSLPDPPESKEGARNPRMDTITQIAYVGGNLLVAGLSNEEFSSNLRIIPFPFRDAAHNSTPNSTPNSTKGASVEIFHGSHKRYETNSPIRTFVPYTIGNQQFILAAYTCTPLVKIPISELKPGNKVKGTTIAELGFGNRPIDMLTYRKDGHDFLLMANSKRGVMRLSTEHLDTYQPITTPVEETAGVPYQTIKELQGVEHLERFDDSKALILASIGSAPGSPMELKTIPLP
jgi:hypothetical protein